MQEHAGHGSLAAFKRGLNDLRVQVGNPDRVWFRRHRVARATLHDLLNGPRVPRWTTVAQFVDACADYARSPEGLMPDDPAILERRYWLSRHDKLAVRPGGRATTGEAMPRLRVGLMPRPAGSYQIRPIAAGLRTGTNRYHVLSGLGGVGKSQMAARLARDLWDAGEVDILVWVAAGSRQRIVDAYATAWARVTGGPEADEERAASRLLEWLESERRSWLVVLDDVADPSDVTGLWPPVTASGRLVVTTRRTDDALAADGRAVLRIFSFTVEEAEQYLRAKLTDRPELADGIGGLGAALGGLPLALSQAMAYVRDLDLSCAEYLARLAEWGLRRVAPTSLPDDQRDPVAATWSLSIRQADALPPTGIARRLLRLAALLSADGIPEDLFTSASVTASLPANTRPGAARDALRNLRRLSLIDLDGAGHHRVLVHALVQRATRDETPAKAVTGLRGVCADALVEIWEATDRDRERGAMLRANASTLLEAAGDVFYRGGVHQLVFRLGVSTGESGGLEAAAEYFSRARATAERLLPADHRDVLVLRQSEMYWLGQSGEPATAGELATALLADCAQVLDRDDPFLLETRLYQARWKGAADPGAALDLLTDLVAAAERIHGPNHPTTLTARNDLAHFRGVAGDAAGAARDFARLTEDRRQVLGPRHEHTLITRNDHAFWLRESGRADEAATVLEGVVADCALALGPEHPFTLGSRGNLAVARSRTHGVESQREHLRAVCADMRRVLGPRHPMAAAFEDRLRRWDAGEA